MLSIGEASSYLGVSIPTIRRWEKKGIIHCYRTPGNHRRFALDQLDHIYGKEQHAMTLKDQKKSEHRDKNEHLNKEHEKDPESNRNKQSLGIYARVSQPIQKQNGDLDRQLDRLRQQGGEDGFRSIYEYKDVGSGLNDKRRGLWKMLHDASRSKFKTVYCTHHDRLSRFAVRYLEEYLKIFNVKVKYIEDKLIPNSSSSSGAGPNPNIDDIDKKSIEQELMEDLMAIIAVFSGKLYGSRAKENFKRDRERAILLKEEFSEYLRSKVVGFSEINKMDGADSREKEDKQLPTLEMVEDFLKSKNISLMKRNKK
ncbi:MAG: IS607 family transposase [Promethearchaeota archaeon]